MNKSRSEKKQKEIEDFTALMQQLLNKGETVLIPTTRIKLFHQINLPFNTEQRFDSREKVYAIKKCKFDR